MKPETNNSTENLIIDKGVILFVFIVLAVAVMCWGAYQDGYRNGYLECTYDATGIRLQ